MFELPVVMCNVFFPCGWVGKGSVRGERLGVRVVGKRGKAVAGGVGGGKVYIMASVCDVLYDAPLGGPGDRAQRLNTPVEKQATRFLRVIKLHREKEVFVLFICPFLDPDSWGGQFNTSSKLYL